MSKYNRRIFKCKKLKLQFFIFEGSTQAQNIRGLIYLKAAFNIQDSDRNAAPATTYKTEVP